MPVGPQEDATLQTLLGYLNFAEGRPDARFQKQLNELYAQKAMAGNPRPCEDVRSDLASSLKGLHDAGGAAFRDTEQADALLRITFLELLPAYRRHHGDLLAHLSEVDLWQPFFLARAFEAVLRQRGPWEERQRIVQGTLKQLNDYVGHRPIAVLESRPESEPYDHERVRPIPVYLRGAGVAFGRYQTLLAQALSILEETDSALLREACFDPALLDELAIDPRAYDFDHPADKRPNYIFGEWDPHHLDNQARYRRFVLRSITLEALWQRVETPEGLDRNEVLFEAAAVLAGTMLMAAGVSGAGPDTHDSSVTLSNLTPRIAKYRDAFYNQLLGRLSGSHAQRLREEAKLTRQPFGAARQALNQYLARERALQLQRRRLALFFAELGDAAASRRQLTQLPVASSRMLAEIHILLTGGRQHLRRGEHGPAADCLRNAEDLLQRGIHCGALVDPWNILGFQGQYPRFQALEDSVRDHRIGALTEVVAGIFDLYARLLSEAATQTGFDAASATKQMQRLAAWWDEFATTTVSDVPHVHGAEAAASAEHVARALATWRSRGSAAGDIACWRGQIEDFRTPKAFALVIEALLERRDLKAALALLMTWLGQADQVPLEDAGHSFPRLALRWMLMLATEEKDAALAVKFFDYLEANAEDWWNVPALDILGTGAEFPPMPKEQDEEGEEDSLYGAAYENVTFKGSTEDDVEGEVLDFMPQKDFDLEHEAERILPRLPFLATVARLWTLAAPLVRDTEHRGALAGWLTRALQNQQALLVLLDAIHEHAVPKPGSAFEAMVEFQRRTHVKERLLATILETCRDHVLATGALRGAGAMAASQAAGPAWETPLLALERHLRNGEREAARLALSEFMSRFREEPLAFQPLSQGGEPRLILRVSLAQAILGALTVALPRQGLLIETWHLLRLARAIEAGQPVSGPNVTEFHRPFQSALQAIVEQVLEAGLRDGVDAETLGAGLESVVEPFLPLWIDHFQTTRLGMLETIPNDQDWRRLSDFIRRYGRDLFTRRFITPGNMSGVLQRGVGAYLNDLHENADPLHPIRLVEELNRAVPREQAERWLKLVLETLLENQEILRDYNQTCTQADFGDNLHLLFDFLRLKTRYERAAWHFRPLHFVHDVLVRRHPSSAAEWREQVTVLTRETASGFLQELAKLEKSHGMRLATVRQRLEERFVGPLEADRLAALVEPALQEAAVNVSRAEPSELEKAVEALAAAPSGVGLDAPPWLTRLEQELERIGQAQDPLTRLAQARLPLPRAEVPFQELVAQFGDWEKELEFEPGA